MISYKVTVIAAEKRYGMKKQISLKTKSFRVILIVSLILILLGSMTGLALYAYGSLHNYKSESRHLINYTLSLEDQEYLEKKFSQTREVYENMPDEVRADPKSESFVEACLPLLDKEFFAARDILVKCREETEQKNVAFVFTDPSHSALVYVIDGDEEAWAFLPGQWIKADLDTIKDIEKSTWRLTITHEDEYGWVGTDYAAIYDTKGKQIGYAIMDLDLNYFIGRISGFLAVLLPAAAILVLFLAFLSSGLLRKHIISHLTSMADAAREYTALDKVNQPDDAPFVFEGLDINTSDELEELWHSMSEMEADFRDSMIRLRSVTAEQERMGAELSIATAIQEGTLPKLSPAFPERNEFDIYASMIPAKEVGGDLYDFFMIDDDHLAMVIADVSGKGVSAALFMVIAKTLIQNQAELGGQDPADVLSHVNAKLMRINKASMFVTTWMAILTISTGELIYVDAGHEYPAIRRNGGSFELIDDVRGLPVAVSGKTKFISDTFVLHPGDTLYVYTDGVPDASNKAGEMFGRERMLEALNEEPDAAPEILDRNVKAKLASFVKDAPQFDDITMLTFRYNGRQI